MNALAALVRAYDRLHQNGLVASFGFAEQRIGFVVYLDGHGNPVGSPVDYQGQGALEKPATMLVPRPAKRTFGIAPNFLWDKASYVLGVSSDGASRAHLEHESFVEYHRRKLRDTSDEGLLAFQEFLRRWRPEMFDELRWPERMRDKNIAFALISETGEYSFLHQRIASKSLWEEILGGVECASGPCLITGRRSTLERVHPVVKGVMGAQSSGASVVSFNLEAFASHGRRQGENAPISDQAAFAYTTALNYFLARNSAHRIQIGDTTVVFWSSSASKPEGMAHEALFAQLFGRDERSDKLDPTKLVKAIEAHSRHSQVDNAPRFHILGLSANAARLSVRFYCETDFGSLIGKYGEHLQRLEIAPGARNLFPSVWRLLIEAVPDRKSTSILPKLAAEVFMAIVVDAPYPRNFLHAILRQMRSADDVNMVRAGILKAALMRNFAQNIAISLDEGRLSLPYLLGRLYACYQGQERAALDQAGPIARRFGMCLIQPKNGFTAVARAANRYDASDRLSRRIEGVRALIATQAAVVPVHFGICQQADFTIGFVHQRFALDDQRAQSAPKP